MNAADGVRLALAELGYEPELVREPDELERAKWPGVELMIDASVPDPIAWRACQLYRLATDGPAGTGRCLNRSTEVGWQRGECPGHSVAALLAGTDPGCP